MRNKMRMSPRTKPVLSMQKVMIYATASMVLIGVVTWLVFLSFNFGNTESAYAATTYTSSQNGNWNAAATWGGSSPVMTDFGDIASISSAHQVTVPGNLDIKSGAKITINSNAKLTINGDMIVQNNFDLTVTGQLVVSGKIQVQNGANFSVNGTGTIITGGNLTLENNANFIVNGVVNIGGYLLFGTNAAFGGNGQVNIIGAGCSSWSGPGSCNENIALPVQLISFKVEQHDQGVKVSWKTASEENNDFFTIEQSTDGATFTSVGEVKGNGTTKSVNQYQFIDENPTSGRSYYRLTQTDYDGKSETFRPAMIEIEGGNEEEISFTVYPNPFTGSTLNVNLSQPVNGSVEILDGRGNKVLSQNIASSETEIQLSLNESLQPGLYYVNLKTTGSTKTVKVMKR